MARADNAKHWQSRGFGLIQWIGQTMRSIGSPGCGAFEWKALGKANGLDCRFVRSEKRQSRDFLIADKRSIIAEISNYYLTFN
jgi:hypothetical protein